MTLADRRPLTNAYEPPLPAVRRRSICGAGLGFGPQSSQTGSITLIGGCLRKRNSAKQALKDGRLTALILIVAICEFCDGSLGRVLDRQKRIRLQLIVGRPSGIGIACQEEH